MLKKSIKEVNTINVNKVLNRNIFIIITNYSLLVGLKNKTHHLKIDGV